MKIQQCDLQIHSLTSHVQEYVLFFLLLLFFFWVDTPPVMITEPVRQRFPAELTLFVEDPGGDQAHEQARRHGAQQTQQPPLPPGGVGTARGAAAVEESHLEIPKWDISQRSELPDIEMSPRSLVNFLVFHGNKLGISPNGKYSERPRHEVLFSPNCCCELHEKVYFSQFFKHLRVTPPPRCLSFSVKDAGGSALFPPSPNVSLRVFFFWENL